MVQSAQVVLFKCEDVDQDLWAWSGQGSRCYEHTLYYFSSPDLATKSLTELSKQVLSVAVQNCELRTRESESQHWLFKAFYEEAEARTQCTDVANRGQIALEKTCVELSGQEIA